MKKLILPLVLLLLCATVNAQTVSLDPFADGFTGPVAIKNAGDDRLFVVEQRGVIKVLNSDGTTNTTPFLDIQADVNGSGERGLLGLAFHPDYTTNGFFYVHYSDNSGDTQISRFSVSTGDANVADPTSEFMILNVNQPQSNHNGGTIAFGTDGYLYIALGDGGGGGDTSNNAQNLTLLLGKLLRIDIDNTSGGNNYAIPADNPFVGDPNGRDEIWAYGLRNPFRFSIDEQTNMIWIGDVGQNAVEEVNRVPLTEAGINYGWRCYEGSDPFNTSNCPDPSELTFPVAEYPWNGGGSVIGGFVYRGSTYLDLQDVYVFADIDGMIGTVDDALNFIDQGDFPGTWVGFGEDVNNELYIVNIGGSILRVQGDEIASIDDNALAAFTMVPNPASSQLTIRTASAQNFSVSIADLNGRIVAENTINSNRGTIDVAAISSGLYLVSISTESGATNTKKLVIN